MLSFKWFRRADNPDKLIVELPEYTQWSLDREVQRQIVQTVADALIAEYGEQIMKDILGKTQFDKAIKDAVVQKIMGVPSGQY